MREKNVYVIDELDGSSPFNRGHYEWSTSVGFMRRFASTAGAICAPQLYGGTLYLAASGSGTHVWKRGAFERVSVSGCQKIDEAYVILGPDVTWTKYPAHNKLLTKLGDKARTVNLIGSCALGLGLVAAGNADVLVQPLISPWDWAAGKLLVEESGGKLIFYEMKGGQIEPLEKLEPRHYNPSERQVGFIAGNEKLTADIMEMLLTLSK